MTSLPKRLTEFAFAPRSRIVWLALAGFFLGSALCPFNPPAEDGTQQIKQGEIMNSPSEIPATMDNQHLVRPVATTAEIETATFALG
ncbi:MAG: hypothetical protein ACLQJ7_12780 [Syntrophobacteraceae bacterium]